MADNVTTTASFSTAFMKPAAAGGETIDAVWGRNVADNTAYTYFRPNVVFTVRNMTTLTSVGEANTGTGFGTFALKHRREYPFLVGSYTLRGSYVTTGGAQSATVLLNGVSLFTVATTVGNNGLAIGNGSFVYDKSALTHQTDYSLILNHFMLNNVGNSSIDVTIWEYPTNPLA